MKKIILLLALLISEFNSDAQFNCIQLKKGWGLKCDNFQFIEVDSVLVASKNALNLKLNISDTSAMLGNYFNHLSGQTYLTRSGQTIIANPINLSGTHVTDFLPLNKLAQTGATPNQIIGWNGTQWEPQDDDVGGGVIGIPTTTINAIPRWNDIGALTIKNSGVTVSDAIGATNLINVNSVGELNINTGGDGTNFIVNSAPGAIVGGSIAMLAAAGSLQGGVFIAAAGNGNTGGFAQLLGGQGTASFGGNVNVSGGQGAINGGVVLNAGGSGITGGDVVLRGGAGGTGGAGSVVFQGGSGTGGANGIIKFMAADPSPNVNAVFDGTRFGVGTITPNTTSLIDLTSTDKGFLVPRMTTIQKNLIATPATGLLVYDTDGNSFSYYDGGTWTMLGGASGITSLNGETGTNQTFETGFLGSSFNISSSSDVHTFNQPIVSATDTGTVTPFLFTTWNSKENTLSFTPPLLRVGNVVSITQSGIITDGYLSSVDWNTFNNKLSVVTHDATLTGAGTIGSPLSVTNPNPATVVTVRAAITDTQYFTLSPSYSNGVGGIGATLTGNISDPWNNANSDGVAVAIGDRILVYVSVGGGNTVEGLYQFTNLSAPWVMTRTTDADQSSELNNQTVTVTEGTLYGGTTWHQDTPNPVIGTDNIVYTQISGGGDVSSNTGTSVNGEIALFADGTGKLIKRATGTGYAKVTSGVLSVQSTPIPIADISTGTPNGTKFIRDDGVLATPPGGVTTLAAIGASPNANGATITGTTLNLQPANGTFGGALTANTQDIGGLKTFFSTITQAKSLGITSTDGIVLDQLSSAMGGQTVRMSPRLRFNAKVWNGASSELSDWKMENLPISGATPTSDLIFGYSANGGTYSNRLLIQSTGNLRTNGLHNNTTAQGSATQQDIRSGTYTPTVVLGLNVTSVTSTKAQWMRVGNVVTVSGRYNADPILGIATATTFTFTLPIASDFAANEDAAGVSFSGADAGLGAEINAAIATDTAKITWISNSTTAQDYSYTYTYEVK